MNKKKSEDRKSHRITCCLNDTDFIEFKTKVCESGKTQQDYVFQALKNTRIINTDGLKELIPQISKIGGNLNQIAYRLNCGASPDYDMKSELLLIQLELEDVWQSLKQFLAEQN